MDVSGGIDVLGNSLLSRSIRLALLSVSNSGNVALPRYVTYADSFSKMIGSRSIVDNMKSTSLALSGMMLSDFPEWETFIRPVAFRYLKHASA